MADAKKPLPDGIIELNGKQYPTWPYVLNAAHDQGLSALETELIQAPTEENGHVAIVKATASFDGKCFTDYGDASPKNVNSRIATALIRMASTRAKGRACRDGCNIGQTMAEEIPEDEVQSERYVKQTPERRARHDPEDHAARAAEPSWPCSWKDCETPLDEPQAQLSNREFKRMLCPEHAAVVKDWPRCAECHAIVAPPKATATKSVYGRTLCAGHASTAGELMGKVAATA